MLLAVLGLAGACGGRQMLDLPAANGGAGGSSGAAGTSGGAGTVGGAAGAFPMPDVGPIDFTQAPASFSMYCDGRLGEIKFWNPCLVGRGPVHEVECSSGSTGEIGWSFLVILPITQNPETVLPVTPSALAVIGDSVTATISKIDGALTFERVNPDQSGFVAGFRGNVTMTDSTGMTYSCVVDATIWAAPGDFE
jgi:hypothetical protein